MTVMDEVTDHFSAYPDFVNQKLQIAAETLTVTGLKSLINFPQTIYMFRDPLLTSAMNGLELIDVFTSLGQPISVDRNTIITEILDGMLVAVHEASGLVVSIYPVPQPNSRAISLPTMENSIGGANSAFNESLDNNIMMLRSHLNSADLQVKTYEFGNQVKNRVSLCFLDKTIDPMLLQNLKHKLESDPTTEITNMLELSHRLGFTKFTWVTHYMAFELPQNTARALKNGKAVLFIDRLPFSIVLPSLFSDLFMSEDDLNHPPIYSWLMRSLRFLGVMLTLILPGLYVALVSVNPDVLRFELAHSIARSRLDVPYPAVIEALLLLCVLELILEAIIRLPSSIGPTITMVGGIVLGQAVVDAKLVSNLLIIILATTTIANAAVVGYQNTYVLRLFKYLLLFLAAILGVLGIMSGLLIICAYIAGNRTLGIPYLQLIRPKGE
ncbi:spore germination protein [Paenibacillus glycanilyticus]|uniref:spore germination protein n=1 Tax=Paenibacillus glycanilyticus TaxID=126569 RepID=UPI00203CF712|nr:spore germination protein [Paenibacillus glycanilyticus]MCM3628413.1 spore germination protein [Paenibacillus glycanilyticus]